MKPQASACVKVHVYATVRLHPRHFSLRGGLVERAETVSSELQGANWEDLYFLLHFETCENRKGQNWNTQKMHDTFDKGQEFQFIKW